jgi:ABC-2 type transport system ATP-binding protein
MVGYIGPNGAGKSTTIKMLTGILVPTGGRVTVAGLDPSRQRTDLARRIGVVFGQRTTLWWDLPLRDSFDLLQKLYRVDPVRHRRNLEEYVDLLDLGDLLDIPVRQLSLGQRMRGDITAALLHDPEILYLDEPTIGLDIAVKDRVREFIRELGSERGTTVMLTTHDLGDIEDICKRIVIIDEGRIIYDGELQAVKDTFARDRSMHFFARGPVDLDAVRERLGDVEVVGGEIPEELQVRFDRFETTAGDVVGAVMGVADIIDVRIDEPAIEDVVRKVYGGQLDLSST